MNVTAYDIAQRFIGTKEIVGLANNPLVLAMLRLDAQWPTADEVPWCSAFANFVAWLLRLPRSKDLRARSWLFVGTPVALTEAVPGFDVVIFNRGGSSQPVIDGPGHVAFYSAHDSKYVYVVGGNQDNSVSVKGYARANVLGVRRLLPG